MNCVFCESAEILGREIIGNDLARAFLTNIPITPGHTLVVPRRHAKTLGELTKEERMAILEVAEKIMAVQRKLYGAEGFNCAWNQEKLAGQSVPHFHLHVMGRKEGDSGLLGYDPRSFLYRTGDREPTPQEELMKVSEEMKRVLNA